MNIVKAFTSVAEAAAGFAARLSNASPARKQEMVQDAGARAGGMAQSILHLARNSGKGRFMQRPAATTMEPKPFHYSGGPMSGSKLQYAGSRKFRTSPHSDAATVAIAAAANKAGGNSRLQRYSVEVAYDNGKYSETRGRISVENPFNDPGVLEFLKNSKNVSVEDFIKHVQIRMTESGIINTSNDADDHEKFLTPETLKAYSSPLADNSLREMLERDIKRYGQPETGKNEQSVHTRPASNDGAESVDQKPVHDRKQKRTDAPFLNLGDTGSAFSVSAFENTFDAIQGKPGSPVPSGPAGTPTQNAARQHAGDNRPPPLAPRPQRFRQASLDEYRQNRPQSTPQQRHAHSPAASSPMQGFTTAGYDPSRYRQQLPKQAQARGSSYPPAQSLSTKTSNTAPAAPFGRNASTQPYLVEVAYDNSRYSETRGRIEVTNPFKTPAVLEFLKTNKNATVDDLLENFNIPIIRESGIVNTSSDTDDHEKFLTPAVLNAYSSPLADNSLRDLLERDLRRFSRDTVGG